MEAQRNRREALAAAVSLTAISLVGACGVADADSGTTASMGSAGALGAGDVEQRNTAAQKIQQTRWGPLNTADRDLLAKVRLAGLWEIPTGQQAAGRAAKARTRKNLSEMAHHHIALDELVRSVAEKLRVPLPNEPTEEQQAWMDEISAKTGTDYDRTAVRRLRMAHGKVYPVIATVRASTQNTLIRSFAKQAETFVHAHLQLLEETGFVDQQALPPPPDVKEPPKGGSLPAPPATELI